MYMFSNQDGEISRQSPQVDFLDHGFLFGDSIYEVVRLYDGKLFGWKEHKERLLQSAKRLDLPVEALIHEIEKRMKALFRSLGELNACIRMVITRGIGKLHIDPRTCKMPKIYMAAWKYDDSAQAPDLKVYIPNLKRNLREAMDPAIKSGNYLNNIMGLQEALRASYSDALFLNYKNEITELTTSNIAWIRKGCVETPSTQSGILHGVTRNFLIRTLEVKEGHYPVDVLDEVEEIFALSTLKEILPIYEIKSASGKIWKWQNFHQTLQIHEKLRHTISKELEEQERIL